VLLWCFLAFLHQFILCIAAIEIDRNNKYSKHSLGFNCEGETNDRDYCGEKGRWGGCHALRGGGWRER
jgi:hypothetical protein